MTILLVGINHRGAPVEIREKLALNLDRAEAYYRDLESRTALTETFFLSTCNRVELLAVGREPDAVRAALVDFLAARGVPPEDFEPHLYVHRDREAAAHLFRVAASLDSMVLGEPQILGQLKEAYRAASARKAAGPVLNKLIHKSFHVAKRVRTETGVSSSAVSIGYAAVELARKIFGRLSGRKVLLIGAGEMAELTAEHLLNNGAEEVVVANRTLSRAVELAGRWRGRAASLEEIPELLREVDVVISSTGSAETIIRPETVKKVRRARKRRPLFFVDIAVPRDVDPAVNRLENVYLYDIDDLGAVVEENRAAREKEAVRAQRIVEEETIAFLAWLDELDVFPTIIALTQKADAVRRAELRKTLNKMGDLSPEQLEALDVMTKALTHKLIHDPILFLKRAGRRGDKAHKLNLARRILGLDRPDQEITETKEPETTSDSPPSESTDRLDLG